MGSLADIRAGIAGNLATLQGIQVSAYVLSSPTLPTIWVRPAPAEGIEYHRAFANGLENWTMLVQAYFANGITDIGAQKKLDELLESSGATSVKAAIEATPTLTNRLQSDGSVLTGQTAAAQSLKVERNSGYQEYGHPAGTTALGCEWTVVVYPIGG